MNTEFNEGDVLVEMDSDEKYVVEDVEVLYTLRRLKPESNILPPRCHGTLIEEKCLKVGKWVDGKEVDDDDQT